MPHSAVLNGVKNSAPTVENAVIVTDRAVLPRAKLVRKFEMLPPGQHATRMMPSAMLGCGSSASVSAQAVAGSSRNCASMPISTALGADLMPLKSSHFMSSATPNMTKARMKFSATSDSGLKFSRTASSSVICPSAPGACP